MADKDFRAIISAELDTSKVQDQLKQLNNQNKIKLSADTSAAVKNVDSFGDSLKRALNIGSYASITIQSIRLIRQAVREAIDTVQELDKSLTNLKIVTNQTNEQAKAAFNTYNAMAKELNSTTNDIITAATEWKRQGKSESETNILIRDTAMLAKTALMSESDAVNYLTSSLNGYKLSANQAIDVVDKFAKLDSGTAVTAAGLAQASSKVANTAYDAEVSFDRLLGILSTIGEVTKGNMSSIGNALKTMLLRINGIKLSKLSIINADGVEEDISNVETVLKGVGIDIRKTLNEFDSSEKILDNLAEKWNTLSSVQKSAISSAIAGTRQTEFFRAMMNNYDKVKQYTDLSADSAGTAEEKFSKYADSMEAKANRLRASFESLSFNVFSSDIMNGITDSAAAIVEFTDKANILKGTLSGIISVGLIKGFTSLATLIGNTAIKFNQFNAALKLSKTAELSTDQIQKLSLMTANLSKNQLRAVLSSQSLANEQRIEILTANGLSDAEAKTALATMGLSTAESTAATTTFSLSGALKGLFQTLLANPLVAVGLAISTAVAIISTARQKAEQAQQEMLQQAKENSDNLKESLSDIDDYKTKINELHESLKNDNLSQEEATDKRKELLDIQDELIKKYGNEKDVIDSITAAIQGETNALDNLSKSAAREYLKKNEKPIVEAQNYFNDSQDYSVGWLESGWGKTIDTTAINLVSDFLKSADLNTTYQTANTFDWLENQVITSADQMIIRFKGTRDEIVKGYDTFYDYIEKYLQDHNKELSETTQNQLKDLLVNISTARNNILHDSNDTYNTHSDTLETAAKSALISSYSDIYSDYLKKQEEYKKALAEGNQDIISQEYQSFDESYQALTNGITFDVSNVKADTIKNYLNDVQQEFAQANKEQPLIIDIKAELADSPESFASKIKSDIDTV